MTPNKYTAFQKHQHFDKTQHYLNTLPERLLEENKTILEPYLTDTLTSILANVTFASLSRSGVYTHREQTYVRYIYDTPELTIRLWGVYDSNTDKLLETNLKVILGEYPDSAVTQFTFEHDTPIPATTSPSLH